MLNRIQELLQQMVASLPPGMQIEVPPKSFVEMQGEFLAYEEGKSMTMRYPFQEKYQNPIGHMQGGFIVAAIDNTLGPLSYLVAQLSVTTQLNTTFVRPVTADDRYIEVVATIIERTKTQLHLGAQVFNQSGKLLAISQASCTIMTGRA